MGFFFLFCFVWVIYFFPFHLGILRELLYENDAPRYPNHHRVRLSIMSPGLHHEIWIPFIPSDEMTVERILISIERVLQSDKKWLFAGTMRLTFVHTDLPVGNGHMGPSSGRLSHRLTDMLRRKRTIIQVPKDQHDMCCARAIVVGMAQLTSGMSRTGKTPWGQQVRRYVKLQVSLANALMSRAGMPVNRPCGLPEWEKFQAVLGKISLVVVSKDHFNTIVYYGGGKVRGQVVALYLAGGHYHTITRLPAFLGVRYVCPDCFGSSVAARHHRCRFTCKFCAGSGKCQ